MINLRKLFNKESPEEKQNRLNSEIRVTSELIQKCEEENNQLAQIS